MADVEDDPTLDPRDAKGVVSWFTRNPVAANLLMLALLLGGIIVGLGVKQAQLGMGLVGQHFGFAETAAPAVIGAEVDHIALYQGAGGDDLGSKLGGHHAVSC